MAEITNQSGGGSTVYAVEYVASETSKITNKF